MRSTQDTISNLIDWGHATLDSVVDSPRLDAEVLLAFATGKTRSHLAAWPEGTVGSPHSAGYRDLVHRRASGEPVAYLIGHREFWSLDLEVSDDTLIPRPETELLVERALQLLPSDAQGPVLDLGTGCGAIALALAAERPGLTVIGVDRCPAALAVAQHNAKRLQLGATFLESDWFSALAGRRFALIVANPPYVPSDDPHMEQGDLCFEPRAALDGGSDGLKALRTIISSAPAHLLPQGVVLLEHGFDQGPAVMNLLTRGGFDSCRDHADLAGCSRVAEGHWVEESESHHEHREEPS